MVFQARLVKENDLASRLLLALHGGAETIINAAEEVNPVLDFAHSVARTLADHPKWLECRFLYDARGSALFEKISEQPEYYLTRTEAAILEESADEVSEVTGPVSLVELGSGSSLKTRHIFRAYLRRNGGIKYVPVDVSRSSLQRASADIKEWNPAVRIAGIKGAYECVFPFFTRLSPVLVIFLGSTIGNFNEVQEHLFWREISRHLSPGDFFLLGVDLVKDPRILENAYNDKAGVTAAFTLNLFERMNRELKAGVDLEHVRHVAHYSFLRSRIEIFGHFTREQRIAIKPLNREIIISAGERIHVEISRKFDLGRLIPRLQSHRFKTRRVFADNNNWFALLLLERDGND